MSSLARERSVGVREVYRHLTANHRVRQSAQLPAHLVGALAAEAGERGGISPADGVPAARQLHEETLAPAQRSSPQFQGLGEGQLVAVEP